MTLENPALTGGLTGLSQDYAPTFIARNVVIQDTSGVGVRVRVGDARLTGCTVQRSGGIGIDVMRGGSVTNGSTIAENAGHGSPITIDKNTITGNHGDGVMGYIGTTLVLHGNVIRGNGKSGVACMGHCLAQIGRATIENNGGNGITLVWGAKTSTTDLTSRSVTALRARR